MTQRPGYTYHEVTLTLGTAQYADVDKHVRLLPQRLFPLARRPVEFTKRKRRDARDKLETKRRSAARDKALGRH